jgi:hypothetical protein
MLLFWTLLSKYHYSHPRTFPANFQLEEGKDKIKFAFPQTWIVCVKIVLVTRVATTKYHRLRILNDRNVFINISGG